MTAPFLTRAEMRYKDSYIAAAREFESEKRPLRWKLEMLEEHFDEYLQILHEKEFDPQPGFVPSTEYWLIVEGDYVGTLSLRHHLNERLLEWGGHIGYQIRPSRRRQGYGLLQCQLGLEKAREMGIERALITCDDTNIGSIKIIEACGGVLENKIVTADSPIPKRRYWVTLT
jgi:predicted acetyltransferase